MADNNIEIKLSDKKIVLTKEEALRVLYLLRRIESFLLVEDEPDTVSMEQSNQVSILTKPTN